MKPYYRIQEAANLIGVSASTLRNYANQGKISFGINPAGQRIFTRHDIDTFMGKAHDKTESLVFYVRSSDGDSAKMNEQVRLLTTRHGEPDKVYRDKASGLSEKRSGLQALLRDAHQGKFSHVAITEKDRLTRFGFSYLETLLSYDNIKIIVDGQRDKQTLEQELMSDFMSLIASFSGKFYRLRGYEQKRRLLKEAEVRLG